MAKRPKGQKTQRPKDPNAGRPESWRPKDLNVSWPKRPEDLQNQKLQIPCLSSSSDLLIFLNFLIPHPVYFL